MHKITRFFQHLCYALRQALKIQIKNEIAMNTKKSLLFFFLFLSISTINSIDLHKNIASGLRFHTTICSRT